MISVVPTVDTGVAQPRIRLDVTSDTTSPAPVAPDQLLAIYRVDPDGTHRRVLLTAGARLSAGVATGYDYHAPFNQPISYIANAAGYMSTPAPILLSSTVSWLMHPLNPLLSMPITVKAIADVGNDTTAILSRPFGADKPISLSEGVQMADDGQLTVKVKTQSELAQLKALLHDSGPLLMNLANADGWWDQTWSWIQRMKVIIQNPAANKMGTRRHVVIPYQAIDTPAGAELPVWTCLNVTTTYATCADVTAAYASCGDLTTNTLGSPSTGSLIPDVTTPGLFLPIGLTPDPLEPGLYIIGGTTTTTGGSFADYLTPDLSNPGYYIPV